MSMDATPITERFVNTLADVRANLDEAAMTKATHCLQDFIGVTMAGAMDLKERHATFIESAGPGGTSIVIGQQQRSNLFTAALLNGVSAHQLELDDGHRFGMVHPGATVIAALLPLVQTTGRSGTDLLQGVIMGYEATVRLASALQPAMKMKGYHATGTCGTMGAAIGAAVAMGIEPAQWKHVLAAAATQSAGLLEVIRDGSNLKAFNAGQAALHGLVAANMVNAGYVGPNDVLGGKHGFLAVMGDVPDLDRLLNTLGVEPAIHGIYVKPYAVCRHAHPAVGSALKIHQEHALDISAIERVAVRTYGLAVHLHDHTEIEGVASAKMSTPYGVAVALTTGRAGMEEFTPAFIQQQPVLELTRRIQVLEDASMSAKVPHERAAEVEVFLRDGRSFKAGVRLPKGEPEDPLSEAEAAAKFEGLVRYAGKSAEDVATIAEIVRHADTRLHELYPHL